MPLLTAAEWMMRAEEARELAGRLRDVGARQTMRAIADGYEKLARHAASWADAGVPPNLSDDD